MEEYSDLISKCDSCIQKTYTTSCFNCEVYIKGYDGKTTK